MNKRMKERRNSMNDQTKHPFVGFLLSVFPGGGQFYYSNIFRGMFYFFATVLPVIAALFLYFISGYAQALLIALIAVFFYFVSFIDTIIIGVRRKKNYEKERQQENSITDDSSRNE